MGEGSPRMRASQQRRLRSLRSALVPRPAAAATPESLETPLARGLRLPVVDLRAADAAAQLVTACTEVGFQCVVGHGLEPAHGAAAVSELEGFFGAATPAELGNLSPAQPRRRGRGSGDE